MKSRVNTAALAPLLDIASTDPEPAVSRAALDAAARLPLGEEGWRALAAALLSAIEAAGRDSPERTVILVLAVRVPLLSMRRRLRSVAADSDDAAAMAVGQALAGAGDPSQIERLLAEAAAAQWHAFEGLAAMPLEQAGVSSSQWPAPPPPDQPQARFWYALAAARLNDWRWIDRFVAGEEPEPPIFFGPPSVPYSRIAACGPWPEALAAHLAAQLARTDDIADPARQRMARIIVGAVTGMTDADGMPIDDREARDVPPSRQEIDDAVGAARAFLSEATVARFETEGLGLEAASTESGAKAAPLRTSERSLLAERIVTDAHAAAVTLPQDVPANQVIGNPLVRLLGLLPAGRDWPVGALVQAQLDAPRTALDDAQLAWVIARAAPARWIGQLSSMLSPAVRPIEDRLRILQIAADAAEHAAGRGPSPFRGSGGHGPNVAGPRRELIDDVFPDAGLLGAAPAADELSIRPKASEASPPQGDAAVFCPPVVGRGSVFLVQVFFYPPDRAAEARDQALEADAAAQRRGVMALPPDLPLGTRIDLHLEMPGLRIDEPDAVLVWSGRTTAAQFEASVPSEAGLGNTVGRVRLSVAGVPIGTLRFQLAVAADAAAQSPRDAGADVRRYRRAFVSYSSQDRAEVLRRVQAFRIAGLEVFQDILDLEPGQRWERELYREIDRSDVFMLFWSSAAAASPWVSKEIDYALARKQGREDLPPDIAPVPIEGPPIPPPPERLRHLHFNDALLAHIAAAQAPPKS
jgi:hypothetical protein